MRITEENGTYYLEGEAGAANGATEIIVYNDEIGTTEITYIEVDQDGSFDNIELTGIPADTEFWVVASYDHGDNTNDLSAGTKMTTPSSTNSDGDGGIVGLRETAGFSYESIAREEFELSEADGAGQKTGVGEGDGTGEYLV